MSAIINHLKSLFVVEVEERPSPKEKSEREKSEVGPKGEKKMDKEQEKKYSKINDPADGQPSAKFIGILINAMQDAREDEIDYLHFKENLKSLKHLDFDEKTKFQTAFAIAKNQGIDKEKLEHSCNYFLKILESEDSKFQASLENQKSGRIGSRKEKIKSLRDQIFQKQSEIEQLKEDIRQLEGDINKVKDTLMEQRERIEKTASDFQSSLHFLRNKIVRDLENINKFLD